MRRYAYERLTAPDRTAAHTRLRDYFAAVPEKEKIETLNDLAPVIELYHHMVRAGQFDAACDLAYDRFADTIYFQFGAYQTYIELMLSLFPDGEDNLPRLKKESDQAWTLNELANAYSLNGEPRRAIPLFEMQNDIYENKTKNKEHLAIGLGNMAQFQLVIGALGDAERNLRRRIELCREIEDEFRKAVGHQELGRVLAYRGLWAEAEQELDVSIKQFEKVQNYAGLGTSWSHKALKLMLEMRGNKTFFDFEKIEKVIQNAFDAQNEWTKRNYQIERELVRNLWLLGASYRANGDLEIAEKYLSESLRRCRAINAVDGEADILLEVSKLRHAQGSPEEALRRAQEALIITERSSYVLQGADVNLWLAELSLTPAPSPTGRGESEPSEDGVRAAKEYAETALKLAHCDDGPPYHYKVAYEEAQALLKELEKRECHCEEPLGGDVAIPKTVVEIALSGFALLAMMYLFFFVTLRV